MRQAFGLFYLVVYQIPNILANIHVYILTAVFIFHSRIYCKLAIAVDFVNYIFFYNNNHFDNKWV